MPEQAPIVEPGKGKLMYDKERRAIVAAPPPRARLCEAAIDHAADAIKDMSRVLSKKYSPNVAQEDLANAIGHLQQALSYATESAAPAPTATTGACGGG